MDHLARQDSRRVRFCGTAPNLALAPPPLPDEEVWCCNNPIKGYHKSRPEARDEWTRWFNLHSLTHMQTAYPKGLAKLGLEPAGGRIIYTQRPYPEIPASRAFPRDAVLHYFGHHYVTFTGAWMFALAILEGFTHIDCYGFRISPFKPAYRWERPCFFYWIQEARRRGLTVTYPSDVEEGGMTEPGDPWTYTGPLYGYDTRPDPLVAPPDAAFRRDPDHPILVSEAPQ